VYQFYVKQPQAETCLANERQRWEQTTPEDWQAQREEIIKAWLLEWQKPAAWQIPKILEACPPSKDTEGKARPPPPSPDRRTASRVWLAIGRAVRSQLV
jgi:hypothetical protein